MIALRNVLPSQGMKLATIADRPPTRYERAVILAWLDFCVRPLPAERRNLLRRAEIMRLERRTKCAL